MSESPASAIELHGVGKRYKMFESRRDNFLDALGLQKFRPWRKVEYQEFWALRDIDFTLGRGERVGVIGRNGAGKSTLLKLVTQNLVPTEGTVQVHGTVQALLDAGGGLHPEFTGYENIRAALTYQGLSSARIKDVELDIEEFTELGDFLSQPFKTYSLGMQARLAFAIATAIEPDILIIDEMLGAGDAYFFSKSMGRMRQLVESGASVLIVSHALDQISRFCQKTIWLERGHIVGHGPTATVVRDYERFIRSLENRRLRGKSARLLASRATSVEQDAYGDICVVRVRNDDYSHTVDVHEIRLTKDGEHEDRVLVGSPQDSDVTHSAFVQLDHGTWSPPAGAGADAHRSLAGREAPVTGNALFSLWTVFPESRYTVTVVYRSDAERATLAVVKEGHTVVEDVLPPTDAEWREHRIELRGQDLVIEDEQPASLEPQGDASALSRWPGEGQLRIVTVTLLDADDGELAVFTVGQRLRVRVQLRAERAGSFPLFLAGIVFRLDGIVATRHVSEECELQLDAGEIVTAELDLGPLALGNGHYSLSVGLYRQLDVDDLGPSRFYDYIDRSYEFQIVGAPRMHNELVFHQGTWSLRTPDGRDHPDRLRPLWEPRTQDSGETATEQRVYGL